MIQFLNRLFLFSSLYMIVGCLQVPGETPEKIPAEVQAQLVGRNCKIATDTNGHVHIQADSELVATSCWGYQHAKDRIWQMDFYRRVAQGRSAEMHGWYRLKTDVFMRLLQIYERASNISNELSEKDRDTIQWLWAYSYGVNKAIDELDIQTVYEFKKTGAVQPLHWTPTDSIALLLLQSFDQTRKTFMDEFKEQKWIEKIGVNDLQKSSEDGTPWDTSILKTEELRSLSTRLNRKPQLQELPNELYEEASLRDLNVFGTEAEGSNNWVVAAKRTKNSKAILANDPHLALKHPSSWHWGQVKWKTPTDWFWVMGASFPGIPIVASGFNSNMAWGLTNAYLDSAKANLVSTDTLVNTIKQRPTIWIKTGPLRWPFVFKQIEWTKNKLPVLPIEAPNGKAYVLYWSGFEVNWQDIVALHKINRQKNIDDHSKNLVHFKVPSWNFVFADQKGEIGYMSTGRVIKHLTESKFGNQLTSHGEDLKPELFDANSHLQLQNPARGYIVTANNRQVPKSATIHGGRSYRHGFRAEKIEELIQSQPLHDIETMKSIACDITANDAKYLAPLIVSHLMTMNLVDEYYEAVQLLKNWNYQADLNCLPCAIYRRTVDGLEEELIPNYAYIYRWLNSEKPEIVEKTLKKVFSNTVQLLYKDKKFPTWSELHKIYFRHPSEDTRFYTDKNISTPGDDQTINPGSATWKENHYEHESGASHRLIVELSQPIRAYGHLAGINQDTPDPDFTKDGFDNWAKCEFKPLVIEQDMSTALDVFF